MKNVYWKPENGSQKQLDSMRSMVTAAFKTMGNTLILIIVYASKNILENNRPEQQHQPDTSSIDAA
jgi:hypothetical protein